MHLEAARFCEATYSRYPLHFTNCNVLEVGSLNINGSVRDLFTDCEYLGIDLGPGRGVDQVVHVLNLDQTVHKGFDVVVSTEALEHDRDWRASLMRMAWFTKPGGLLLITCATTGRPEHGTARTDGASSPNTLDWYHNISFREFWEVLRPEDFTEFTSEVRVHDLYFAGIKR